MQHCHSHRQQLSAQFPEAQWNVPLRMLLHSSPRNSRCGSSKRKELERRGVILPLAALCLTIVLMIAVLSVDLGVSLLGSGGSPECSAGGAGGVSDQYSRRSNVGAE